MVVTGEYGSITSAPAVLGVISPVPRAKVPAVDVTGVPGNVVHLVWADTLDPGAAWTELGVVTLDGNPQTVLDLADPLPLSRFYRGWRTNTLGLRPFVGIKEATKLTLTGAIGSQVRVDYINVVGPADAWVTLDAVTLTNSPQPYFDVTAFGQPARLYRVVPLSQNP